MASIKQLIERIETRLFMVAGLDVQIHAEGQIEEMLRSTYNTLFDDFWDPEYTLYTSAMLNGTTGEVTTDLSTMILRYKDIHTVYWNEDEDPLPRVSPGASFGRIRRRSMMPSGKAETVFKVVPSDETGPVHIWYRTRIADDIWDDQKYDTPINMDDEVLLLGVVYEFLVNDDSNARATEEYKGRFFMRQQQLRNAQWNAPLSKRKLERDGPLTRWE